MIDHAALKSLKTDSIPIPMAHPQPSALNLKIEWALSPKSPLKGSIFKG
jgi:hypothetical protein